MGAFNPNSKSRASAWKPSFQSIFSALQRCRTRSSVIDGTPRSSKVSVGNSTVKEFDYDSVRAPSTPNHESSCSFLDICALLCYPSVVASVTWELCTLSFLGGKAKTHVGGFEKITRYHAICPFKRYCTSLGLVQITAPERYKICYCVWGCPGIPTEALWIPCPTRWLGHATPLAIHKVRMFDSIHTLQLPPTPVAAETWSWRNFFRLVTFSFANGWDVAIPQGTWLSASNSARIAVGKPAQVFNVCECFPFHRRGAPYSNLLNRRVSRVYSLQDPLGLSLVEISGKQTDRVWWTWCGMNDDERCRRTWSQMISADFIISYHIISYLIKLLLTASLFPYQACIRWSACR